MGEALEVAEHDSRAVFLGQPADFLLNDAGELVVTQLIAPCIESGRAVDRGPGQLVPAPPRRPRAFRPGDAQRHAVQPGSHRAAASDRSRPNRQDQERRLKRVFNLGPFAEDGSADPQYHRPMPGQERGKRDFGSLVLRAAPGCKSIEQLGIAQPGRSAVLEQVGQVTRGHRGGFAEHGSPAL